MTFHVQLIHRADSHMALLGAQVLQIRDLLAQAFRKEPAPFVPPGTLQENSSPPTHVRCRSIIRGIDAGPAIQDDPYADITLTEKEKTNLAAWDKPLSR